SSQISQLENRVNEIEAGSTTFNNAIILTQGDLPYILHSYQVVKYYRHMVVLAAGPGVNIIINGYVAYANEMFPVEDVSMGYVDFKFLGATTSTGTMTERSLEMRILRSGRDTNYGPYNVVRVFDENGEGIGNAFTSYGAWGMVLNYGSIYAPDELHPHGYAQIKVYVVYVKNSGEAYMSSPALESYYVSFASESEYNAAINLYSTPQVDQEVIETTITDDGNSTLEKAMMYTDSVAKSLETSFANITDADREQITQNTSDIAAHNVRITSVEGAVSEINAPNSGILAQSKVYTDFVADELREEFGTTQEETT
ncbi:MAG: hypothetical protein ACI4Q4_05180, partial [Oscillospiraceae bacterium]